MKKNLFILALFSAHILLFISCSGSDDDTPAAEMEPEAVTLEGDYIGTWNSNTDLDITYTDFGISARLKFANAEKTRLNGEFFATTSFSSCCNSGDNDGTMVFNLDGTQITSFSFNDIITDCTGNFSGTGTITSENPYRLEVDFTGNDCDGNHIGKMIFTRLNN